MQKGIWAWVPHLGFGSPGWLGPRRKWRWRLNSRGLRVSGRLSSWRLGVSWRLNPFGWLRSVALRLEIFQRVLFKVVLVIGFICLRNQRLVKRHFWLIGILIEIERILSDFRFRSWRCQLLLGFHHFNHSLKLFLNMSCCFDALLIGWYKFTALWAPNRFAIANFDACQAEEMPTFKKLSFVTWIGSKFNITVRALGPFLYDSFFHSVCKFISF